MERLTLLKSRFWSNDSEFNSKKFLEGAFSYLYNKRIGEKHFSHFLEEECKRYDINPRVVLVLMDLSYGALRRREEPDQQLEKWCLNQKDAGKGLKNQVIGLLEVLRRSYNQAKMSEPMILKNGTGEILAMNPETFAVASVLWGCGIESNLRKFRNLYETYFFKRFKKAHEKRKHKYPRTKV